MSSRLHIGLFQDERDLLDAARECRRREIPIADVVSPHPVHGIDEILGIRPSRLPWVTLLAGALGATLGLGLRCHVQPGQAHKQRDQPKGLSRHGRYLNIRVLGPVITTYMCALSSSPGPCRGTRSNSTSMSLARTATIARKPPHDVSHHTSLGFGTYGPARLPSSITEVCFLACQWATIVQNTDRCLRTFPCQEKRCAQIPLLRRPSTDYDPSRE